MKVDIEHLAGLARLSFTREEIDKFEHEMQTIVDMVSTLPKFDEAADLLDPANPMELRADVVQPSMSRDKVIGNAAAVQAGCIVVPKTVE